MPRKRSAGDVNACTSSTSEEDPMPRTLDAPKVAAGAALTIAIGAISAWAAGPAALARVQPVQSAAITEVAPPRAAAAELDVGAPAVPSAALPALLLPSD